MATHEPQRGAGMHRAPRRRDDGSVAPAGAYTDAASQRPSAPERRDSGQLPDAPTDLNAPSWKGVFKRAVREYKNDNLSDWAAALTYRAILSIFPAVLVLVAIIGLLGHSTSTKVLTHLQRSAPPSVRSTIKAIFDNAQHQHGAASLIGIIGIVVALWSASGYVSAFSRASNAIYDIREGRTFLKLAQVRVGVTIAVVIAAVIAAGIALLSGGLARDVGKTIGAGNTAVTAWNIAKWPVLVIIISLTISLLYWATPNARQPGFPWVSPGGALAVLIWAAASAGFAIYVANFGSYNKTYGSLAGIIVFLVWLWITNIAILLGAEFNAELQRARAISGGLPESQEPYVDLRDTRKLDPAEQQRAEELSRQLHPDDAASRPTSS